MRRRETPDGDGLSREIAIGIAAVALVVAAMAVDHLLGDDPGLEDPPAFLISSGLSLALAAVLFGVVVPRTKRDAAGRARSGDRAIACSVLALLASPLSLWLGLPFVLGAAGVALGLLGRGGERSGRATTAVAIGAIVVLLGAAAYIVEAVRKLS